MRVKIVFIFCILFVFYGCSAASNEALAPNAKSIKKEPVNFEDKNELLSYIARAALDFYLQEGGYGELREFSINNKTKKLFFKTKLKGEERFLSVSVDRYDIKREGGKYFFIARGITTDREWLNIAAKNFLEERKIEVPAKYSIFILAVM
jgi:hypothetical protein